MSVDVIGNFLTAIRNALKVYKHSLTVPNSTLKVDVAKVLKDEGFIREYKQVTDDNGKSQLQIFLKYVDGNPAINEITRISKPGCRNYQNARKLKPVIGGLGVAIVSTSSGVMTDRQARKLVVGGEVICHVW